MQLIWPPIATAMQWYDGGEGWNKGWVSNVEKGIATGEMCLEGGSSTRIDRLRIPWIKSHFELDFSSKS